MLSKPQGALNKGRNKPKCVVMGFIPTQLCLRMVLELAKCRAHATLLFSNTHGQCTTAHWKNVTPVLISEIQLSGINRETSQKDLQVLKLPVHLHIYCEVMPLLLADLSTWAFSCNCALKASSWLNKPSRCWTSFVLFFFF